MQPVRRRSDIPSLRDHLLRAPTLSGHALIGAEASASLGEIVRGTFLNGRLDAARGKSVLVLTRDQLTTALVLIEIDGVVRRLVLWPPDLDRDHLSRIIAEAEVDLVIADSDDRINMNVPIIRCGLPLQGSGSVAEAQYPTQWVLMTSATTGQPKMVAHDLASLIGAIKPARTGGRLVWGTFYDIRRYGGLQIFLRTILAAASMVLSSASEPTRAFLHRLAMSGVTHISGTPSHWRRALMSGAANLITPKYVRLSGEIADQAILNNLCRFYPNAAIGHAYASTETGLAFEVDDGLEGFPAELLDQRCDPLEMRVEAGSLRVRSSRAASRYLGIRERLVDEDGFIDTGDMLERRGDRYYFVGRRSGIINVGGLKVHPEEVEGVINLHGSVRMSLVHARKSPITGALVVADVVLEDWPGVDGEALQDDALTNEILAVCRSTLPAHKVPTQIRFVPSLAFTPSGKLARPNA